MCNNCEKLNELNQNIGKRLEDLMTERKLTQCDLSRLSGVPQPNIYRYIRGLSEMKVNNLYKLAKALNVSSDLLIFGEENASNSVKIVRCKNCKYFMNADQLNGNPQYKGFYDVMGHDGLCTNTETFGYFDDYCSYGEE